MTAKTHHTCNIAEKVQWGTSVSWFEPPLRPDDGKTTNLISCHQHSQIYPPDLIAEWIGAAIHNTRMKFLWVPIQPFNNYCHQWKTAFDSLTQSICGIMPFRILLIELWPMKVLNVPHCARALISFSDRENLVDSKRRLHLICSRSRGFGSSRDSRMRVRWQKTLHRLLLALASYITTLSLNKNGARPKPSKRLHIVYVCSRILESLFKLLLQLKCYTEQHFKHLPELNRFFMQLPCLWFPVKPATVLLEEGSDCLRPWSRQII